VSSPAVCQGCGSPLPAPPPSSGRRRKWCSEACRKRTLYGGRCVDCGAATSGSEGRGARAPQRCHACAARRAAARSSERAAPRRALIERLWAEGRSVREIGELMGWAENAQKSKIARLRQLGYDLPHRRPA
jgi:DNA-directed RNA polymerase specialized sigma24 family protein